MAVDRQNFPGTGGLKGLVAVSCALLLTGLFAGYGYEFAKFGWQQKSEMSGINMLSIYVSFPVAGITWTLNVNPHVGGASLTA